ncbi:MAG TPA: alanine racemase, partial [Flavisolibacter sp.]|nr:alanine racemase [Flavisolibacter sp.]
FTNEQFTTFTKAISIFERYVNYPFLKHIANSAAIVRHPQMQMSMVRLGIGLYGVEPVKNNLLDLKPVGSLRSTIAQLKKIRKGDSVSYNRSGIVNRDSVIGVVRIGYADGYSRRFSNGIGYMCIKGLHAPVIGSVCMDMTMIDVTDIQGLKEGDEVEVFGENLSIETVATWAGTIPYEIMTSVSQRVKRIYYHE